MVKEVDTAQFDALIKEGKTFVCDFWASWCAPCRMLAPILEEVAKLHPDVEFVKVNVDGSPELARRYGVMSIPFVAVFAAGELKAKSIGYMPEDEMNDFVSANV